MIEWISIWTVGVTGGMGIGLQFIPLIAANFFAAPKTTGNEQ